jgi:hypothetical protein
MTHVKMLGEAGFSLPLLHSASNYRHIGCAGAQIIAPRTGWLSQDCDMLVTAPVEQLGTRV